MTLSSPNVRSSQSCDSCNLSEIDRKYKQIGCIGRGGYGSVFLAEKRTTSRRVAIKVMPLLAGDDLDQENDNDAFERELDAVVRLNTKSADKQAQEENRDLAIVFFHEWFKAPGLACCIVMNFVDGGTLVHEIAKKKSGNPYSERRIGWYGSQLCEALAFAHERGVAHHDVKSANVLVDWTGGGKLVLTDFGTSVAPGEQSVGFTPSYAAPELLRNSGDYTGLQFDKIDAFGLGCILFELVTCKLMDSFTDQQKLGEFVLSGPAALDAALTSPCMQLPWITDEEITSARVGYSSSLYHLLRNLLEPDPCKRSSPVQLTTPFREDSQSPLVRDLVSAAESRVNGSLLTIDNVQLGLFVQRGPDWEDNEMDGGEGSIGVVVELDADGFYTLVAWPSCVEPTCYRIGANNKFEVQLGPTSLPDFFSRCHDQQRTSGILVSRDASKYAVGQLLNENCIVVATNVPKNTIFIAPTAKVTIPVAPKPDMAPPAVTFAKPSIDQHPSYWMPDKGLLLEVTDTSERDDILKLFHAQSGGMDSKKYKVIRIERIQSIPLWTEYAQTKLKIESENWGISNEKRLFHGTSKTLPLTIIEDRVGFDPRFCDQGRYGRGSYFAANPSYSHAFSHQTNVTTKTDHNSQSRSIPCHQMFLARVSLGRIHKLDNQKPDSNIRRPPQDHHSVSGTSTTNSVTSRIHIIYETITQAFPEYLITYAKADTVSPHLGRRRIIKARRATASPGTRLFGVATAAPVQQQLGHGGGSKITPFQVTSGKDGASTIFMHSITAMPQYENRSFEELRYEDYMQGLINHKK